MENKGSVTELSSVFPAEEAQKASRRVQDAIAERQQQLNQLKGFIDDNVNLINLVQRLPDETHHNIMVPFGKAAFFPGRLIHTNEFMVLLGEGYYAERTSKQTVEILKRRGKTLESQTESAKAIMQDLRAEASFFDTTANESAEGLVEIREDYVEEGSSGTSSTTGQRKSDTVPPHNVDGGEGVVEDEEYDNIFSRMDELEKEEEEAEKANESDEDEQIQNEQDSPTKQIFTDQEIRNLLIEKKSEVPPVSKGASRLEVPPVFKGGPSDGDSAAPNNSMINKGLEISQEKKKVQAPFIASNTDTSMAFTGSIVEHTRNTGVNLPEQQTGARSSKPVSRFKKQLK